MAPPIARAWHVIAIAIAATLALCPSLAAGADGGVQRSVAVYDRVEIALEPPPALAFATTLPETQINDAYDADRDGRSMRCDVTFAAARHGADAVQAPMVVPAFAMRDAPGGAWHWLVRWSAPAEGDWTASVAWEGCAVRDGDPIRHRAALPIIIHAQADAGIDGPLTVAGAGDAPGFLRQARCPQPSRAVRLFGTCRAWVAGTKAESGVWSEWIDRRTELFPAMREGGFNLLNQWMAPWEFLLVHHDRAEYWPGEDGWKRSERPLGAEWSSFQCFDQGRALGFDHLLSDCEGGSADGASAHGSAAKSSAAQSTIYLLLSPLPHQCLQMKAHPWGGQESGWSPLDDRGAQGREKLNGFSGFMSQMSAWDFFAADPRLPADDWRSKLFDHQANFYRYLIARWGHSRAIGAWVLIDELDGVGDEAGDRSRRRGWWAHPECERWLADMTRLFRGRLVRADGMAYPGDPFAHPLHAATTSFGDEALRGGNIDWEGGPEDARPDLFGFHWYPHWRTSVNNTDMWLATIDGIASYAYSPIGAAPRLITEFGSSDRSAPDQAPSAIYPTLYHHAIWSAVFAGHAGTPMDWNDGKEFGELRWRDRPGPFDHDHYPIDLISQMKALRAFLADCPPDRFRSCSLRDTLVRCRNEANVRGFALAAVEGAAIEIRGWMFCATGVGGMLLDGLPAGDYQLIWHDPWTGDAVPGQESTITINQEESLRLDAQAPLRRLTSSAKSYPTETRDALGQDVAFILRRRK
ncbi:MAG: hypothetical protein H0W83_06905 [Planctomycetes bacterium]|nr:hypothetical protein [Planctomycetota bacterium]